MKSCPMLKLTISYYHLDGIIQRLAEPSLRQRFGDLTMNLDISQNKSIRKQKGDKWVLSKDDERLIYFPESNLLSK